MIHENRSEKDNLSVELINMTPEIAATWLKTKWFERQRELSSSHVSTLAFEMEKGTFLQGTPIWVCTNISNENEYIVNGNHTLAAIHKSGVTTTLTIVRQKVTSIEQAADSYITFDIHRRRTWGQAAIAMGIRDRIPLTDKAVGAIRFIMNNFTRNDTNYDSLSRDMVFARIIKYESAVRLIHVCLTGATSEVRDLITRVPVFAVALTTARAQPELAEEFWNRVAKNDGLGKGNPEWALLAYLRSKRKFYGIEERTMIAVAASLAWNAFFEKRSLTAIRASTVEHFKILGTEFHRPATFNLPKVDDLKQKNNLQNYEHTP